MSFMRPEAAHAIQRWREVLVGGALVGVGLWWALSTATLVSWIGWVLVAGGLAFAFAGIQRGRFRHDGHGPGMVRVTEGQITYFGPLTGGAVALSELSSVSHDASGKPGHWVLSQPGQPDLFVPTTADGSDALFDVFSSLPGMRTERLLAQLKRTDGPATVVWERTPNARIRIPNQH